MNLPIQDDEVQQRCSKHSDTYHLYNYRKIKFSEIWQKINTKNIVSEIYFT